MNGAQAVLLNDLVELNAETCDLRIVARPTELVGVPHKNAGGRPSEYGATLADIIAERMQSGAAIDGLNAEAKKIREAVKNRHPDKPVPSEATVKRHLARMRGGS